MRSASRRVSVHTMDDAVARQRQDRERAGRQEMLLGAAVVVALVRDRADDRRLVVVPAVRGDAGLLADLRARAVGADQQPRRDRVAVGEGARRCAFARIVKAGRPRVARRSTPSAFAFATSASISSRFSIMCAKASPGFDLALEGQEGRPHRVVELGIGDHHVEHRLRLARDRLPDADRLEQPPRRRGDRRGARIAATARCASAGSATVDRELVAQRLAQRDGQRQPGKAGAADHHVRRSACPIRHRPLRCPCTTRAPSIAG